jgi:hypothetical protein
MNAAVSRPRDERQTRALANGHLSLRLQVANFCI